LSILAPEQPARPAGRPKAPRGRRFAVALALASCGLFGAPQPAGAQPHATDTLQRIEYYAERHPRRAARDLAAWLAASPALTASEQLRAEVARLEIASALESSADVLAQADRVLPRLADAGDAALHARALAVRARMLDFLSRGAEAFADSTRAFDRAGLAGATGLQVEVLVHRAGMHASRADFHAAFGALEQAQRLAQKAPGHRTEGYVAYYAGWLASSIGDRSRTVELFERALAAYRSDDNPSATADTLVGLGLALIRDRRPEAALAPLTDAVRLFETLDDERGVGVAESPRAVALAAIGRAQDASRASDRALAILRPLGAGEELLFVLLHRAQMANTLKRPQPALAALDEARPLVERSENAIARIAFLREWSTALAAAGRFKEAHAALAERMRREDLLNDQRLSRQLAAQRGQIESRQLERDNDLLRREAEATRTALAALERASDLRSALIVLAALIVAAALYGLWWQRRVNVRIAVLAATDHLTGTLNRRRIGEVGQEAFAAWREFGEPLAVALLDLDHFKNINDRHGHAIGDAALRAVADALASQLRDTDRLGRYGGEEFVVVLPRATAAEASAVVDRLRSAVAALRLEALGLHGRLTLSAGVAVAGPDDRNFADLLNRADHALYRAKDGGRNRVQLAA
jgi:diguanylate cyclase (GGDEF)-like protein